METVYTIDELDRFRLSNPDYIYSLRKRYTTQQDLLLRLRLQLISKSPFYGSGNTKELKDLLKGAKGREALALPRKDDVRWHTFTTEQHKEAKALVGGLKEGEGDIEKIVEELERFVLDCGWGE
ncbi:uncharacterized protein H6S33_005262 [Morchella sextelata]|uniref:uncharacterized protein n=1 Tax=Morchella sextelata TaxID=1174677 RepID=UPI001D05AEEC|nr:uncharacterized protein H6S33_005262 [Morchella sextelata]KAH0605280.1 hypothetical protein H6S33_005262 [Morchella sextelata]